MVKHDALFTCYELELLSQLCLYTRHLPYTILRANLNITIRIEEKCRALLLIAHNNGHTYITVLLV
jgi:hypothetical protein